MKKIIIFLLSILEISICIGQTPIGTPTVNSPSGWARYRWLQSDSGQIAPLRDTNFLPSKPMSVLWQRPGLDTLYWYFPGSRPWRKLSAASGDSTTASNGLTEVGNDIRLGGTIPVSADLNLQNTGSFSLSNMANFSFTNLTAFGLNQPFVQGSFNASAGFIRYWRVPASNITTQFSLNSGSNLATSWFINPVQSSLSASIGMDSVFGISMSGIRDGGGLGDSVLMHNVNSGQLKNMSVSSFLALGANTNIGSGFRVLNNPTTQTLRTLYADNTGTWDSASNVGGLTYKVDTSVIATQYDLTQFSGGNTNIGTAYRWLNQGTQAIRTVADGWGINIDSVVTANSLTILVDSAQVATQTNISNIDFRLDLLERTQWYLDGTAGNNLNDGTAPDKAVKTVSRLAQLAVQPNDVINVARNSYFREFLNYSTMDSLTIRDYGVGFKPIFDAADTAYNYLFTKAAGFDSVYQISWTNAFRDLTDVSQYSVWENGQRLIRVASAAACEAKPGSYFAPTPTQPAGTDIIYVNSSRSDSIPVNGFLYEISRRPMGAQVRNNGSVYNIHTKRNGANNGSIQTGLQSYLQGVIAEDGVKHNAFMESGTFENGVAWKCDSGFAGGTTLFVAFTTSALTTNDAVFKNCIAIAGKNNDPFIISTATGIYAHVGGPQPYRSVFVDGGHFMNCSIGVDGEPITMTVQNANFYRNGTGISKTAVGTLNVINNTFVQVAAPVSANTPTINFLQNKVRLNTSNQQAVRGSGTLFNLQYNTIYTPSTSTNAVLAYKTGTGVSTVFCKHNIFTGGNASTIVYETDATEVNTTITSDSNYVRSMSWGFAVGSSPVFKTLAQMQSSGYELHSSNGIQESIFYGNKYTQDFFIRTTDTLYGKAGSASSYDSVYRFAYNLFNLGDSLFQNSAIIETKADLDQDNNPLPIHSMNAQNLYVYQLANLYQGATTWNKIFHQTRTMYYSTADSLALTTKWYVDSSVASGGSSFSFTNGLTNTASVISNDFFTGKVGGLTVKGGTAATDDLSFQTTTGTGATGSDFIWLNGTNGATERMRLTFGGNLGVNTNNPGQRLSLQAETGNTVGMDLRSSAGVPSLIISTGSTGTSTINQNNSSLTIQTAAANPLILLPGTVVGVGTGTPGNHKVDVLDNRTAQTASISAVNGLNSNTYNTTGAALTSWGGRGSNNSTRSSGSNALTTFGVEGISFNTGQINFALGGQIQSALTNTVATGLRLQHITSGTAAANFGTEILVSLENASGNNVDVARLQNIFTTATNAAESSDWKFFNINAGSLAQTVNIRSNGELNLGNFTDQGAAIFQVTGGVYLSGQQLGNTSMKMLVHGNDSLVYQIPIPSAIVVQDSTQEYTATFVTTDGSTNTIASIPVATGTNTEIQVTCVAVTDDGNSSFTAVKYRNFHKNSTSGLANGTLRTISADEYTGIGLTTATFTIINDGSTGGIVTVTGEIGTVIEWKVKYKIVSITNSL